jgi:hypothetical protein
MQDRKTKRHDERERRRSEPLPVSRRGKDRYRGPRHKRVVNCNGVVLAPERRRVKGSLVVYSFKRSEIMT